MNQIFFLVQGDVKDEKGKTIAFKKWVYYEYIIGLCVDPIQKIVYFMSGSHEMEWPLLWIKKLRTNNARFAKVFKGAGIEIEEQDYDAPDIVLREDDLK